MKKQEAKVIRDSGWHDGADFPNLQELLARAMSSDGCCCVCGAEQPDDVRWPAYAFELDAKDGSGRAEIEFRTCPRHEATLDAVFDSLGEVTP